MRVDRPFAASWLSTTSDGTRLASASAGQRWDGSGRARSDWRAKRPLRGQTIASQGCHVETFGSASSKWHVRMTRSAGAGRRDVPNGGCRTLRQRLDPDEDATVFANSLLDALGDGDADAVEFGALLDDDEGTALGLE
jgi:hypothetical protein